MTSILAPVRRRAAVLALVGAVAIAGCGGSTAASPATSGPASSPAASATPAITAAPPETAPSSPSPSAAPSEAPSAAPTAAASDGATANPDDLGGFAFPAADILAYYDTEEGFDCAEAEASTQAAGYAIVRCFRENTATGTTDLVALVMDPDGVVGNAFAGTLTPGGTTGPTVPIAFDYLAKFFGATLGEVTGGKAASWYGETLTKETDRTAIDGMVVLHYRQNDDNGVGFYVEIANEAFLTAPSP